MRHFPEMEDDTEYEADNNEPREHILTFLAFLSDPRDPEVETYRLTQACCRAHAPACSSISPSVEAGSDGVSWPAGRCADSLLLFCRLKRLCPDVEACRFVFCFGLRGADL